MAPEPVDELTLAGLFEVRSQARRHVEKLFWMQQVRQAHTEDRLWRHAEQRLAGGRGKRAAPVARPHGDEFAGVLGQQVMHNLTLPKRLVQLQVFGDVGQVGGPSGGGGALLKGEDVEIDGKTTSVTANAWQAAAKGPRAEGSYWPDPLLRWRLRREQGCEGLPLALSSSHSGKLLKRGRHVGDARLPVSRPFEDRDHLLALLQGAQGEAGKAVGGCGGGV